MDEPSIDECFRLLKLKRGADFSTVKQAYRRNLNKCHPDRFQDRKDLLPVAERKTKRLVQVYGILERWYQGNGGIDLAPTSQRAEPSQDEDEPFPPAADEEAVPVPRRRAKRGVVAAGIFAAIALFAWSFLGSKPASLAPSLPADDSEPAELPPPRAERPPLQIIPGTAPDSTKASLAAMVAERDRVKASWVKAYTRDGEANKRAAEKELADALGQYIRDVRGKRAQILEAQAETARQLEQSRQDAAAARDRFAKQEQAYKGALKADYDTWLSGRGVDAVAIVKGLRKRENSDIGVFSDTEDPYKIFEFWTADEAGTPEINIAAKTGVTVRQPDDRFFPHFRSNIYLYSPEGQVLVHMMESIAERHAALMKELESRTITDEAELANWDVEHPGAPPHLGDAQEAVMEGRDKAIKRVARARTSLEAANAALGPSVAESAFEHSPSGRLWAERILVLQKKAL